MTSLQIRTRLVATAAAALLLVPAFAQAQDDAQTRKEIPGGRQRIAPRPVGDGPALAGIPAGDATVAPAPSLHGFGPMSGNPLFMAVPVKSTN